MVIKGPLALVFAKVTSPAIVIVAPDAAEIVRVSPLATVKALIVTEEQSERSEASSTLLNSEAVHRTIFSEDIAQKEKLSDIFLGYAGYCISPSNPSHKVN